MAMLRSVIASLALLLLVAGPAGAQGVIVDKSEIRFVSKQMGVNVEGKFRKWKANVVFLPKDLARSKVQFEIDLGSIDLASDESETEIKSPLWFDIVKFPTAHFASTSIKSVGADRYEIAGRLTLKGTTRDIVVPIAFKRDASGNKAGEGSFSLKRLDFKVGEGLWSDPEMVANDVTIRVRMVLPPLD